MAAHPPPPSLLPCLLMEQVLFCRLTKCQLDLYRSYLRSSEMASVLDRDMRAFKSITLLRKLCNHPDLMVRVFLP